MPKKPRASAKNTKRATPKRRVHRVSDAMRAEDESLREKLRKADLLNEFDDLIGRAIATPPADRRP